MDETVFNNCLKKDFGRKKRGVKEGGGGVTQAKSMSPVDLDTEVILWIAETRDRERERKKEKERKRERERERERER